MSGMAVKLVCTDCGEHRFIVERDDADAQHVHCVDCGRRAAMALGFTATLIFWTLYVPLHQSLRDSLKTGIPYAICGALAGLVTWWAGERLSYT